MKRFRVGIISNAGMPKGESFDTLDETQDWLLQQLELSEGVKLYRILDREIGEIIETEKGVKI